MLDLNQKTKLNIERARQGKQVHMASKSANAVQDGLIRNAMNAMKAENPWSIERFLREVTEPDYNDSLFELINEGNNFNK